MGLYDNIQAPSSQYIDTHSPIPLEELQKSRDTLDERYNQGIANEDALHGALQQATAGPWENDQKILAQAKQQISAEADARAAKGDYEHMNRSVANSARKFGQAYAGVAANAKGYQDYQQSLIDAQASKNPNEYIDPQKAKDALKYSMDRAGAGLQVGPDGKFTNYFQGYRPAATYDIEGKAMELLSKMHPSSVEFGHATIDTNPASPTYGLGVHQINGQKVLANGQVQKATRELIAQHPEWMADLKDRAFLHSAAQGKDASMQELMQLGQANPSLGVQLQKAAQDPNFDPIATLTGIKLNQSIGGLSKTAGDILSYSERSHDDTTTGSLINGKKLSDDTGQNLTIQANLPGGAPLYKDRDGLINVIQSTADKIDTAKKNIEKWQKSGVNHADDIAEAQQEIRASRKLYDILQAKKTSIENRVGMGKPLSAAEQKIEDDIAKQRADAGFYKNMNQQMNMSAPGYVPSDVGFPKGPRDKQIDAANHLIQSEQGTNSSYTQNIVIPGASPTYKALKEHGTDFVHLQSTKFIATNANGEAGDEIPVGAVDKVGKISPVGTTMRGRDLMMVWRGDATIKGKSGQPNSTTSVYMYSPVKSGTRNALMTDAGLSPHLLEANGILSDAESAKSTYPIGDGQNGASVEAHADGGYTFKSWGAGKKATSRHFSADQRGDLLNGLTGLLEATNGQH